jgi:hypothetical protein
LIHFLKVFFDSNFFVAFVGLSAIFLYFWQKNDYKRAAAKLILQEIRYAEQQIRNAGPQKTQYPVAIKLLPTSSWHKNIHLFVTELEQPELDVISRFYASAAFIDIMISEIINKRNSLDTKGFFGENGKQVIKQEDLDKKLSDIAAIPNSLLVKISQETELVYNTPVVEKLKEISKTGLFHSITRRIFLGDI